MVLILAGTVPTKKIYGYRRMTPQKYMGTIEKLI